MAKTLGSIVGAALNEIGEGDITEFTTGNVLQNRIIDGANNMVRSITSEMNPSWGLKRTSFVTNAEITTGSAAVTDGSTTVSSVTSAGVAAANWTSPAITADMWFRGASTSKSYAIDTVTLAATDSLTIEQAWIDSTSTALGYKIFQDTYAIADSDFGELRIAAYGDANSFDSSLQGYIPSSQLSIVPLSMIYQRVGGDIHRDSSGHPRAIAKISVDSSDNQRFVLFPYPTKEYLIEIWYDIQYSENTTFATNLFSGDAPLVAYDAVEHSAVAAACEFDDDFQRAAIFEQKAATAFNNLKRLENRQRIDASMDVETYRRTGARYPTRSATLFDTVTRR